MASVSILRSAIALLVALVCLVSAQDTQIPLICHDGVQIIAVVGANVPNGTESYGLTVTFVKGVMANVSDSSNFSVNYKRDHLVNETAIYFQSEVQLGVPALQKALVNYTTACPNTPVVLHGYSEGAVVVANMLCGASSGNFPPTNPLNSSYARQIIAVVLYGDQSRTANQSYDLSTCTASGPRLARRHPEGCDAFAPTMKSYCFANDVSCCSTANASAPWPYGINPHYLYPAGYDNEVIKFVIDQYAKYKNGTFYPSSSSSSSSSTTTSTSSSSTSTTSSAPTTTTTTSISSTTTSPSSISSITTSTSSISSSTTSPSSISSTTTSTSSKSSSTTSPSSISSSTTSTSSILSTTTTPSSTLPTSTSSSSKSSTSTSSSSQSSTSTSSATKSSSSSSKSTTSVTVVKTTITTKITSTTTKSSTSLLVVVNPTCSLDKCLQNFTGHPKTASSFCSQLSRGTMTTSIYTYVCSGDYKSRATSACGCITFVPAPAVTPVPTVSVLPIVTSIL